MSVSKVILNGTTLMDVTQDTVASSNLLTGYTAHGADGDAVMGEYATPSGTINITSAGTTDVTSYATASVAAGSAATPSTSITANPSIMVSSGGLITATVSESQSVTPTVSSGFITSGTAGTVSVGGSSTEQLTVQAAQTITPTSSAQTIASGKYLMGAQTIEGVVCANLSAENIVSGVTVKVGTATDDDSVASVTGTASGGGGGYVEEKGVNFYDYDGTLVASYTAAEFADLSALPPNPSHTGLTAQGWNWSLSDAKTYVAAYGFLDIGQMYVTSDGKTRIYIFLNEGRLSPYLGICVNGSLDVDWGDGSTHSTLTGTSLTTTKYEQHTYSAVGDYVIALTPSSGSTFSFYTSDTKSRILRKTNSGSGANGDDVYLSAIVKVEIGIGMSTLKQSSFRVCYGLQTVTIPSSVTSFEQYVFSACSSLLHVNIPSGASSISLPNYMFTGCYAIRNISFPLNISSIGNSFLNNCRAIKHVTIPSNVTSIGTSFLSDSYGAVYSYVIIPNSVTSVGNSLFSYSKALQKVVLSPNITSVPNSAFSSSNIRSITIPSEATSIGSSSFYTCIILSSITIPDKVASIAANAFANCYGLAIIKFEGTTPPTVANSNAWSNLPTDCKIYVPRGYLSTYTGASNYPSSSTYTYVEY